MSRGWILSRDGVSLCEKGVRRVLRFTFSNLPAVGWKLPMRDIVTEAQRVEALGEVIAAYCRASEPVAVGASR
jgi:hypothetical protein